jgi:hypothetical protein
MSEYTAGILFLKPHSEQIDQGMRHFSKPYFLQVLNATWDALFIEDEWLREPSTVEMIKALSYIAPLLRFIHPRDEGWGYMIFQQGEMIADVYENRELSFVMALEIGEQRYSVSDEFFLDPRFPAILAEVEQSPEYQTAFRAQFKNRNVAAFQLFGMGPEITDKLDELLSGDATSDTFERTHQFKELIGITEMEWKSYHYIDRDS